MRFLDFSSGFRACASQKATPKSTKHKNIHKAKSTQEALQIF